MIDFPPFVRLSRSTVERLIERAHGYTELESGTAVDGDAIFRIASITKIFTTVAVLQLVERDLVQLELPVVEYLDWFGRTST